MSTTVAEVIGRTREEVLDDTDEQKYNWSNAELIHLLNRAVNEIIKVGRPVVDQTTAAIRTIKLLSNLGIYALDSRVLTIESARLQTNVSRFPLVKTTEQTLNATVADWRNIAGTPREIIPGYESGHLSVYPKFDDTGEYIGVSNISFNSITKTISKAGEDFSDLTVGDEISVSGSGVIANDTVFTVVTVGTSSFTVTETVTTVLNTSATIRKVRDTMLMTVTRLMTARFTENDIAIGTIITDFRDDHIDGLTDGIAKRAFLKPDDYTYFPQKAETHRIEFERFKKEVKIDMILLNKPGGRSIRRGTGIGY